MNKKPTLFNLNITQNETDDGKKVAEIDIDGVIGYDWMSAEEDQNTKERIREQLRDISEIEADEIMVNISSLGGDVNHGLAIYDLLAENPAKVTTKVNGMTASAGTIIAQAGDERIMSDNALYLIHQVWTMGTGNRNKFKKIIKDLEKTDDRVANIYAKRGGKSKDFYMELMQEENGDGIWLNADEALENGLIDEAYEPLQKVAMADESMLQNLGLPVPQNLKENDSSTTHMTYKIGVEVEGMEELKAQLEKAQELINDSNSTLEMQDEVDLDEEIKERDDKLHNNGNQGETYSSRERELSLLKFKQNNYGK